jgi:putative ABC transport system substrate-binding protein
VTTPRLLLSVVLTLGLLVAPRAGAPQATTITRVGFLSASAPSPMAEAFRRGLRDLGYVEDRNIVIYSRWAEGRFDRLPDLAAELVSLNVDILVAVVTQASVAAKNVAGTTPIVMVGVADPVGAGLVDSLARPGRNITGTSSMGDDAVRTSLQLLMEVAPRVPRVAVLWNPANPVFQTQLLREAELAGPALGVQLQLLEVRNPNELERAFAAMTRQRAGALLVLPDPMFTFHRQRIIELAARSRLPAMYGLREWADAGGLMSYGANYTELSRRAATYVDKILKGAAPAGLPVEQPTKFELVVNLKAAKALNLKIPQPVLLRADEVVE